MVRQGWGALRAGTAPLEVGEDFPEEVVQMSGSGFLTYTHEQWTGQLSGNCVWGIPCVFGILLEFEAVGTGAGGSRK